MDRLMTYLGQVPLETDTLNVERFSMIGLGYALQGYLGTNTAVDGFTCIPTGPASLSVIVTPGTVNTFGNVDNSAFSSLPADTTHQIVKQGILYSPQTSTLVAPTTTGFAVNYLIEVSQQDIDGTPVVLPFFNPSNPTQAWTGPGGLGSTNNTIRQSAAVVQVKPGVAAPAGTQTTPSVDAGFVPLFVVTVAFGQTTITSASISQHAQAPFLDPGAKLPQAPYSFQNGQWTWAGTFGGSSTALTATLQPAPLSLVPGFSVRGNITTTTTGQTTLNVNGLGAVPVIKQDGSGTLGGELNAGQEAEFTFTGSSFVITSGPTGNTFVPVTPSTVWFVDGTAGTDAPGKGLGSGSNAFRSIIFAVAQISKFFSFATVTVNVATGTYAGFTIGSSLIAGWNIVGSGVSTCAITSATVATNLGRGVILGSSVVTMTGFTITSFYEGIDAVVAASATISGCNFVGNNTATSVAVSSVNGSTVSLRGSIGISGTYQNIFVGSQEGTLSLGYKDLAQTFALTVTFGTTSAASAVVLGNANGVVLITSSVVTFAGSTPTGQRYLCNVGGGVSVGGGGVNFIPGTIAGVAAASTTITTAGGINSGWFVA